jgi:outer membrane immunogenic protein
MLHRLLSVVGVSSLLIAALLNAASAADMPVKAPPLTAPVVNSWSGWYAGLNAGYGWGSDGGVGITDDPPGSFAASFAAGQVPRFVGDHPNGFVGGGQIGYNYQIDSNWLVGLEGDFSGTGIKSSGVYDYPVPGRRLNTTVSQSLDWLATVRGRVGYVMDRLLVYGTGGAAFGEARESFGYVGLDDPFALNASASPVRTGWAAGAGVEYKVMRNISVKAEWLHYDLGKTSASGGGLFGGVPQPYGLTGTAVTEGDLLRSGVNFEF